MKSLYFRRSNRSSQNSRIRYGMPFGSDTRVAEPRRLPVVLSKTQVTDLPARLDGVKWLGKPPIWGRFEIDGGAPAPREGCGL